MVCRLVFGGTFLFTLSFAECAAAQAARSPAAVASEPGSSGFPTEPAPPAVPAAAPSTVPPVATPTAPAPAPAPPTPVPSAPPALAPKVSPLQAYRSRELYTRFSFWSGQKLMRDGNRVDLGYFGGNADSVFAGSDDALSEIQTFRTMRITGTTLYVVGLGLMVADVVLLASGSDLLVQKNSYGEVNGTKPLALGLLVSGFAAGMTGAFLMQGANSSLSDAVELYNADLARRLEGRAFLRGAPRPMLRFSGVF